MAKRREGKRGPAWTQEECQREFLEALPRIRSHLKIRLRRFLNPEEWDNARQEGDCLAWQSWVRAWKRGKDPRAFVSGIAHYTSKRILSGRTFAGQYGTNIFGGKNCRSSRERLAPLARGRGGPILQQLASYILDNSLTPVPDQVCFRIDFPTWMDHLPYRWYRQARLLLAWKTTKEVARELGLSPTTISQGRRVLRQSWEEYTA